MKSRVVLLRPAWDAHRLFGECLHTAGASASPSGPCLGYGTHCQRVAVLCSSSRVAGPGAYVVHLTSSHRIGSVSSPVIAE